MRRRRQGHPSTVRFAPMLPCTRVLSFTFLLTMATAGLLIGDAMLGARQVSPAGRRFQRVAGGLGMGATVAPRWCFINFDPRIERCTCMEQPLAGGYCYCPEHSGTVSYFSGWGSRERAGQPATPPGGAP